MENEFFELDFLGRCVNSIIPWVFVLLLIVCLCIIKVALGIFLLYYCSYVQNKELDELHQEEEKEKASNRAGNVHR